MTVTKSMKPSVTLRTASTHRVVNKTTEQAHPHTEEDVPFSALFAADLPYKPPRSALGRALWRRRVWFEITFGASVLEPWEKLVFSTCTFITWSTSVIYFTR